MKKTLALILSALLLLSAFTSCSKKPRIEETEEETKVEATIGDGDNNNNGDNNTTTQGDWNTATASVYAMTTLKIRSSASVKNESNVVATVAAGTNLTVTAASTKLDSIDKPEWYKISYNNQECYVVGAFVTTNFDDTVFEGCTPEALTIKDSGDTKNPYKVSLRTAPAVSDTTFKETLTRENTSAGQLQKIGANKSGTWFMVSYDFDKDGTAETYYIKMTQQIRTYFGLSTSTGGSGALG
jgi:hypothetical protein